MDMLSLHWIRPNWLLLIPLVWLAAVFAWRQHKAGGDWARIADAHLLKFLGGGESQKSRNTLTGLVIAGLTLALLALAGPAWEQSASGSFSANQARVVVLDLSRSMLAEDIKPNRVAQARFKLMDLLDKVEEGQVGLVAYAGQAFVIAPLSSDMETIKNMVPALGPDVMPAPGSRPDEALALAAELINQAGFASGEILLIADSSDKRTVEMAEKLADRGFVISVLGIGTTQGAPIPSGRGFIKDREGKIVVARLDENKLRAVARAGDGDYLVTRADNSELTELLGGVSEDFVASDDNDHAGLEQRWLDQGYWLLLLLLPIVLLSFRKGWLFVLPILLLPYTIQQVQAQPLLESPPPVSFAADGDQPPAEVALPGLKTEAGTLEKSWRKLWWNADQRAQLALQQQDYQQVLDAVSSPRFQAEALYRQGDFSQAMELWSALEKNADTTKQQAEAAYNQGNALAAENELDDAIAAYGRALVLDPENTDAQTNLDILKKLQDQQNQEGEQNQEEGEEGENQEDQQSQEDQQNQDSEESQDSEDSEESEAENENEDSADSEEEQQQAEEEQQQAEEEAAEEQQAEMTQEEQWTEEDEQAKEQWLRRIPDDPGGLLRRKLIQEHKRRGRQDTHSQPW
ncbi:MAG: VWA domain-containing protein [Proteobacteria bacterium]|nr:VWA domain-containing protein [Pseudomonadota bacterium]